MKLKYLLTGLLISLLSISFSSAWDELILPGNGYDLGNSNYCSVNSDLSFSCSSTNNIFQNVGTPAWGNFSTSFWWNNDGLGFYQYSSSNSSCNIQGIITGFTFCEYDFVGNNSLRINNSMYWSSCLGTTYSYDGFSQYASSHELRYWSPVSFSTTNGYAGIVFVFDEGAFRTQFDIGDYCTNFMYGNYGLKDFGLVGLSPDFSNLNIINSPANKSPQYYYSTGSCPSVGQYKYASNLTPDVCYSGYPADLIYTAGEDTLIQAGSGINIFETYAIFSGNMSIQSWYDTYWVYYNNISFNPYPFYNKPKALLGLMLQRQMAGIGHSSIPGSYAVLNYCWYVVNNYSDNASTCLVPTIQSTYSGINITSDDIQFINDSVNEDYVVHTPTSGSIFDDPFGGAGGGGSSWGDDKCESIPCLFDKFYQMFTSSRINDVDFSQGGQGILPQYIALAFVVVVLFYVFKR